MMKAMFFRDYLHEKVEESKHNETLAYPLFPAGAILFVGGILETLKPSWKHRTVPVHPIPHGTTCRSSSRLVLNNKV